MNTSHEKWLADRNQKLAAERSHRRVSIVSSAAVLAAFVIGILAMVQLGFYAVLVPALLLIWVASFVGSVLPGPGGAYARAAGVASHYRWTSRDRKKIHGFWAHEWLSTVPALGFLLLIISHHDPKDGGAHHHQPRPQEIEPLMVTDLPDLLRLASDRDYASAAFRRGVRRGTILTAPLPVLFAAIAAAASLTILYAVALTVMTVFLVWALARVYHGWTVGRYMDAYRYLSDWCTPDAGGEVATAAELAARTTEGSR